MFKHPGLLWLFLIYIPLVWWYLARHRNANPSLGMSTLSPLAKVGNSWKKWLLHGCFLLQLGAIGCIIVALARPQTTDSERSAKVFGTDIVLALDISGSMSAKDMQPTRFDAAKQVAMQFVSGRPDDNVGLVAFAGESLSLMPLTNDRAALVNAIQNVKMGDLDDGTAIGDGLASALNRLSAGKAKSKSIILLTDGSNNAGDVPPETAAKIAVSKGVKIYTIGVGTDQRMTITDPYGFSATTIETKIDEASLRKMGSSTGGRYFRARDEKVLRQVFSEIDKLEKSRLEVEHYTRIDEAFMPWVAAACGLLALMMLLRYTLIRRIP